MKNFSRAANSVNSKASRKKTELTSPILVPLHLGSTIIG